jgi:glyoxylase-like metal-dependent hydrolase (beta-lactamase superfamily II)
MTHLKRGLFLLALATASLAAPTIASANAPFAKIQAPGFYRMMLGDFEITALNDGTFTAPMEKMMAGSTPAKITAALAKAYMAPPFETSINTFLVNTGTKLVLIDTGGGAAMAPTVGKLVANLKASGYTPEQVDEIYITHMHGDHLGGLVTNGKPTFPNAIVRAAKQDADFWLVQANADKAPEAAKGNFKAAMAAFSVLQAAGKFKPFDGPTDLVPGVKAVPSPGHTPGHTFYAVESKGQKLVAWGDLMHVAAVQFADPTVGLQFDADGKQATAARKAAFADAAKNGYFIAVAHLPFPGIGKLGTDGSGYRYYPTNYTSTPVPPPPAPAAK